jgi:hypothetical protein
MRTMRQRKSLSSGTIGEIKVAPKTNLVSGLLVMEVEREI